MSPTHHVVTESEYVIHTQEALSNWPGQGDQKLSYQNACPNHTGEKAQSQELYSGGKSITDSPFPWPLRMPRKELEGRGLKRESTVEGLVMEQGQPHN